VAFEVNEVRCLLRWLETIGETGVEWKTLVLIAGFTAMRLADALNLTWEEVDLDAEEIRFDQNKLDYLRRKGVEILQMCIPIHGELLRRLRYHRDLVLRAGKPLKGYIVPYLQGRGEDQIGGAFIKLLNQAGLWTEQAPQKGFDRKPLRRGFHSFRHAVITWMKKAGIAKELRKEFAGHSEESASHDDYDHAKNDAGVLRKHVLSALPSLDADPDETGDTEPLAAPEIALSSIPTEALMGELAKRVGTTMEK
jgi:integrase